MPKAAVLVNVRLICRDACPVTKLTEPEGENVPLTPDGSPEMVGVKLFGVSEVLVTVTVYTRLPTLLP